MKRILTIALLAFGLSAAAQERVLTATVVAATPTNLLSGGKYLIKDIILSNTNAAASGQFWFYDSTGGTNYVQAAYTQIGTPYATNYSVVWTNAAGLLITNTVSSLYTPSTSVSASTNQLPKIVGPHLVGINTSRTLSDVNKTPNRGFTLYSTVGGSVEVLYEQITP